MNSIFKTDVSEKVCVKRLTTIMSGNNNLFVVSGGPVIITELCGYVKTEIEGKSCLIKYNFDPTVPATDTPFAASGAALEINGDAVGAIYTWSGVIAEDLIATDAGVALGCDIPALGGQHLIVPPGSLELAAVVATSATGSIEFYLRYKPLSPGSVVNPA